MPPRRMRNEISLPARVRQEAPGGQKSPRAPMTASATFAPRAGASSGFHRYTVCKFPAPVLKSLFFSSPHPGAGGCWWLPPFFSSPYSPFRVRPHNFQPGNSAVHSMCGCPLRFPDNNIISASAPTHQTLETRMHARFRMDEFRYLFILHQKSAICDAESIRIVHNSEQEKAPEWNPTPASLVCSPIRAAATT
jgi:hypothetical protein